MKKIISAILAFVMLCSVPLTCAAADTRASTRITGYILGVSSQGNSEMVVSFSVLGKRTMDKIGAYSIRIEEEVGTDKWITTFTKYGSSDPKTFYTENEMDHSGYFFFTGTPGVKYRAVMVAYAEDSTGYEYSREVPCDGKVCK